MAAKGLYHYTYCTDYNGQSHPVSSARAQEEDGRVSRTQLVGDSATGDNRAHPRLRNSEQNFPEKQAHRERRLGAGEAGEQGALRKVQKNLGLVVDANIFFSALIRKGFTRRLFFLPELILYAPDFILTEIEKHRPLIVKKSELSVEELEEGLNDLLRKVVLIAPHSDDKELGLLAFNVCPDKEDFQYFALALKLGCPLWSNDKVLKGQDAVQVYSTSEILELLKTD